ncbi:MAG: hypothetical protein CMJ81_20710 [Planctomycetaceae bacterium]|nr:hypothetical protein [Planctomycetaceae bacterium]MBP62464.1 hypothetical protein [Planctomycetaceae bacterium]
MRLAIVRTKPIRLLDELSKSVARCFAWIVVRYLHCQFRGYCDYLSNQMKRGVKNGLWRIAKRRIDFPVVELSTMRSSRLMTIYC